jgi:hypothetical protein
MATTYVGWTFKLWDLWNESYLSAYQTAIWGQERLIDLNKSMLNQLESEQSKTEKFFDQLSARNNRIQELYQEVIQDGVQLSLVGLNTVVQTTSETAITPIQTIGRTATNLLVQASDVVDRERIVPARDKRTRDNQPHNGAERQKAASTN